MSQCNKCQCFDWQHVENEGNPNLEDDKNFKPDRYFFWHGDIKEDYDMGKYDCLCEVCYMDLGEDNWVEQDPNWPFS